MPPGVYVDTSQIQPIIPPGIDPTVVCLIGPAVGYHTYTETVSFAAANSVVLTQQGINVSSIVVQGVITDPSAPDQTLTQTFLADAPGVPADYSTTVNSSLGASMSVTTLVRNTGGTIELGHPQVTVTYNYSDAAYHTLQAFDSYDSFAEMYGPAWNNTTGAIVSPLTLAAQFAILNGANYLYAIATTGVGSVAQQFSDAWVQLTGNHLANVIVPIWQGVTDQAGILALLQTAKGLVESDARDGYLRMVIAGPDQGYAPTPTQLGTLGTSTASSRVVVPWPNQLFIYNGITDKSQTLDGWYHAAALSGILAANTPEMPLTRKTPLGFVGMPASMQTGLTKSIRNDLSASGICVTEVNRGGQLIVRHGLTTNYAGGVMTREICLVRAQDGLYQVLEDVLDNSGLIGTPITAHTALQVKSVTSGGLEYAKKLGLITDYNSLTVRQQTPPSGDPTVVEVRFAYKPSWPLNYILVSFTIDTSSSDSTLSIQDQALINSANVASASGN